jgi:probable addiction module antidote protein
MVRVSEFDPSAFLDDDEVVAEYLTAALEDPNPDVFLAAVGHVAKARGMTAIAERAGLGRESLYKAFARHQAALRHRTESAAQPRREAHRVADLTITRKARDTFRRRPRPSTAMIKILKRYSR